MRKQLQEFHNKFAHAEYEEKNAFQKGKKIVFLKLCFF